MTGGIAYKIDKIGGILHRSPLMVCPGDGIQQPDKESEPWMHMETQLRHMVTWEDTRKAKQKSRLWGSLVSSLDE